MTQELGTAFVDHFYKTFDSQVDGLGGLFNASSMMTFEGEAIQGGDAIMAKLKGIGPVKHDVKSTDVQPSQNPNAIIIFVTGAISIGGNNPLHFCSMIQLLSSGDNSYVVHNLIFRLNYGL